MSLQTHYRKKDGSINYSYRCSGYANKIHSCTAHGVGADAVETLLLNSVQRLSRYVLKDEAAFAQEMQGRWQEKQEARPRQDKSELTRLQKRHDELDRFVRGLYENFVSGILPERQYRQLMKQYDDEQGEIEDKIQELEKTVNAEQRKAPEIEKFIAIIRKYKNPTEITDTMFRELIDKIVVHEGTGQGENRAQRIDIYFNFIGQFDVAYTEAELAEQKAQQEQIAAERLARQREREKGYREKRKAKKIAENGGVAVPNKVCPCCGEEFAPTSNRQVFCSPDCRYVYAQNEKKKAREAERGDHYYRQKNCMVCGKLFWPTHSQQTICSDECRKKHHAQVTLDAYHKKQAEKRNGGHPYPERICEVCGERFWPDSPAAKVCSEDCRLEKKRRESRAAYARQRQEQAENREIA
jgi:predicted nucleic acid-binding Zn ribbon protein